MNAPSTSDPAHRGTRSPGVPRGNRRFAAGALAVLLVCGTAAAQAAVEAVETSLVESLLDRTHDPDAIVRGEAALALATVADASAMDAIRAVAEDRHPAARLRGLVALGALGTAGVEVTLGAVFEERDADAPRRHAAAIGLGLLPPDHLAPAIDHYLGQVTGASPSRERDTLACLLAGWSTRPMPLRASALRAILDNAAIRDGDVRALAFRALAEVPDSIDADDARTHLDADSPKERLAALAWFVGQRPTLAAGLSEEAARLSMRDPDARVRAAALALLLRARSTIALEVAEHQLDRADLECVPVAVRTLLQLGGGRWRERIADEVARTRSTELRVAILDAWTGPLTPPLVDTLASWLDDERREGAERLAAACTLARETGDPRAVEFLTELACDTADTDDLTAAVDALRAAAPERRLPPTLLRYDLEQAVALPARIAALAPHEPDAVADLLIRALDDRRLDRRVVGDMLAAFRRAKLTTLAAVDLDALPRRVRHVLAPSAD